MVTNSSSRSRWVRRLASAAVFLSTTLVAYVAVSAVRSDFAKPSARSATAGDTVPVNPFAATHGSHLIAFVLTASDCGWSNTPAMIDAIGTLRSEMRAVFGGAYAEVSVVGVALDKDVATGLQFLSGFRNARKEPVFDQVFVGGSWLNEQVVRFVWRESVTAAASPQIVVLTRSVDTSDYITSSVISVGADQILANPVGTIQITEWLRAGMPLAHPRAL